MNYYIIGGGILCFSMILYISCKATSLKNKMIDDYIKNRCNLCDKHYCDKHSDIQQQLEA